MIIYYGRRMFGRVHRCGSTFMATMFVHLYFMPIIPLGSHLVLEELGGGRVRSIPSGLDWRSTVAAYLRTWGIVAAVAAAWNAYTAVQAHEMLAALASYNPGLDVPGRVQIAISALFAAAVAGAAVLAWVRLGRLSLDERAQRLVYAEHAGYPIDVARLRESRETMREKLLEQVIERGRQFIATGYRFGYDPHSQWADIALDASVKDAGFVGAALTLSRLEWALATPDKRRGHAEKHAALWSKLREMDPSRLAAASIR